MSVVIEGLALVSRRDALDARYPGGAIAYASAVSDHEGARLVCIDRDLVSVSFTDRPDAEPAADDLGRYIECVGVGGNAGDFMLVEELTGPVAPCGWLGWARPDNRPAYAWLATVPQGQGGVDPVEGRLRMCEENGSVTWLDLRTGAFIVQAAESRAKRFRSLVSTALRDRSYRFSEDDDVIRMDIRGETGTFSACFCADDETLLFRAYLQFGSAAPSFRHAAVLDVLNRINRRIAFGNFDLDPGDGEVRFRFSADMDHLRRTAQMVHEVLGRSICVCDRYYHAIMAVAYGNADAGEAISRFVPD